MKKLWILVIAVLFCGCELNQQEHYAYIKVDFDKTPNAKLHSFINPSSNYISIPLDQDIYLSYGTVPETKEYIVLDVTSSNQDVIIITNIDKESSIITAHTLSLGNAKLTIKTDNCYSSTTLPLQVE